MPASPEKERSPIPVLGAPLTGRMKTGPVVTLRAYRPPLRTDPVTFQHPGAFYPPVGLGARTSPAASDGTDNHKGRHSAEKLARLSCHSPLFGESFWAFRRRASVAPASVVRAWFEDAPGRAYGRIHAILSANRREGSSGASSVVPSPCKPLHSSPSPSTV